MQKKFATLIVPGVYLLLVAGLAGAAEWANPDLLITPEALEKNISKPDWVVIDSRDLKDYAKGHIPGAISLGKRAKKALRDPTSRVFSNVSKYEKLLGKAGIGNNTHVVFYHGDIKTLTDASVGFWVMEYLGHDKVHFMDGGLEAWRNSGFRLEKNPTIKEPTTFKANVVASRLATIDEITGIATVTLTDSARSFATDSFNDGFLKMRSGAKKGEVYKIADTTATTIVADDDLEADGVVVGVGLGDGPHTQTAPRVLVDPRVPVRDWITNPNGGPGYEQGECNSPFASS